jgi:copper(I)-binding protein
MRTIIAAAVAILLCAPPASAGQDEDGIRHLLHSALASRLAEAERTLAPERLSLFAKFEGTLTMDAAVGHPQHPPMHQAQTHTPAAATFRKGDLVIEAPWLRATPHGAQVAGGYMKITNTGRSLDRLVDGTLDRARRFEVHETTMVDNVMRMRPLSAGLEIKPGETLELKPGGYHIMGMDLDGGYQQGQTVRGTLRFEKAGTVEVEYMVQPIGSAAPRGMQH